MIKPSARMYKHAEAMLLREFDVVEKEFQHKDVFGFTPNGSSCEIEIKVSDYDFYKEFGAPRKKFKHKAYKNNPEICPTRFYFFVPSNLVEKALRRMKRSKWYNRYGLISYHVATDQIVIVKKSEILSDSPFLGEILIMPFKDYRHKNIYIKDKQ